MAAALSLVRYDLRLLALNSCLRGVQEVQVKMGFSDRFHLHLHSAKTRFCARVIDETQNAQFAKTALVMCCIGGVVEVSDRLSWSRHFFVSTVMAGER